MANTKSKTLTNYGIGLIALVSYALVAGTLIAPSWLEGSVIGDPDSEIYVHLWQHWWIGKALQGTLDFLRPDLINFPLKGQLFPINLVNSLLYAGLRPWTDTVSAYNLVVFLHLIFGCWGGFFLTSQFCQDRRAALPAGFIVGVSPFVVSYSVASGVGETLNVGWLCVFLAFLIRALRESTLVNPVLAAMFLAVTFVACPYHGQLGLVTAACFICYFLVGVRSPLRDLTFTEPTWRDAQTKKWTRRLLTKAIVFSGCLSVLLVPYYATLRRTMIPGDAILSSEVLEQRDSVAFLEEFHPTIMARYTSTLQELIAVGKRRIYIVEEVTRFYRCSYVGLSVLALAAAGFLLHWNRRLTYGILIVVVVITGLAIGPYMPATRQLYLNRPISPVYLLFFHYFPGFTKILEPFRFVLILTMLLAIPAAKAIERTMQTWRRSSWLIPILFSIVILADFRCLAPIPWPLPTTNLATPKVYQELSARVTDPAQGILELPFYKYGTLLNVRERFYYQTSHAVPIAETIHGFGNPFLLASPFWTQVIQFERSEIAQVTVTAAELAVEKTRLQQNHFAYVLVDTHHYSTGFAAGLTPILSQMLGAPVLTTDDGFFVYCVGTN